MKGTNLETNNNLADQAFTAKNITTAELANENILDVQTLGISLTDKIFRQTGNFAETVEDRIQSAFSTAMNNFVITRIWSAVRSLNASSGQDVASIVAISERGEQIGITVSFENLSDKNITFHESNIVNETRGYSSTESSKFPVPKTHFDGQSHTHHNEHFHLEKSSFWKPEIR